MMTDFGLYIIITKPVLSYRTIAEICVENKIRMLQLREKHLSDKELFSAAREIKSVTRDTETRFVVNDRPDIALLVQADVLHLGQDDLPPEEAGKIAGSGIKIGLSTHSVAQAEQALKYNPDYIGFGPVYATPAKAKPDPVVGTEKLKQILSFVRIPVVAIGGIFPENIENVLNAGARNVAMVRYFMETKELDKRIKEIQKIIDQYKGLL